MHFLNKLPLPCLCRDSAIKSWGSQGPTNAARALFFISRLHAFRPTHLFTLAAASPHVSPCGIALSETLPPLISKLLFVCRALLLFCRALLLFCRTLLLPRKSCYSRENSATFAKIILFEQLSRNYCFYLAFGRDRSLSKRDESSHTQAAPRMRCAMRLEDPGLEVPGLVVPGLEVPGLEVPGLEVPGLEVPGLEVPGLEVQGLEVQAALRMRCAMPRLRRACAAPCPGCAAPCPGCARLRDCAAPCPSCARLRDCAAPCPGCAAPCPGCAAPSCRVVSCRVVSLTFPPLWAQLK